MEATEAVQILINDGIASASRMLEQSRKFQPYARSLTRELGILDFAHTDEGFAENNPLAQLEQELRDRVMSADDIAIAIFTQGQLRDKEQKMVEALQIGLEHQSGYCLDLYFPYQIDASGVIYGELISSQREARIFRPDTGTMHRH